MPNINPNLTPLKKRLDREVSVAKQTFPKKLSEELKTTAVCLQFREDHVHPRIFVLLKEKYAKYNITIPELKLYHEKKIGQYKKLKEIEARKNKAILDKPESQASTSSSKKVVIDLPNVPQAGRPRKTKAPTQKIMKMRNTDPLGIKMTKPPTPTKIKDILGTGKQRISHFKIPKKGSKSNDGLDEFDNIDIIDPLASILPQMDVPVAIKSNPAMDMDWGAGDATPCSPRANGSRSPSYSKYADIDLGDVDNPFDADDDYYGEGDFANYNCDIEPTARDLPPPVFDINAEIGNKKQKEEEENLFDEDSNQYNQDNDEVVFDDETGNTNNESLDDSMSHEQMKPEIENNDHDDQKSTSSSKESKSGPSYTSLGDDELDYEDDSDDDGNFKRRNKKTSSEKSLKAPFKSPLTMAVVPTMTHGSRPHQTSATTSSNATLFAPFQPPVARPTFNGTSRPLVARNVDPVDEAKIAQRATRFASSTPASEPSVRTATRPRIEAPSRQSHKFSNAPARTSVGSISQDDLDPDPLFGEPTMVPKVLPSAAQRRAAFQEQRNVMDPRARNVPEPLFKVPEPPARRLPDAPVQEPAPSVPVQSIKPTVADPRVILDPRAKVLPKAIQDPRSRMNNVPEQRTIHDPYLDLILNTIPDDPREQFFNDLIMPMDFVTIELPKYDILMTYTNRHDQNVQEIPLDTLPGVQIDDPRVGLEASDPDEGQDEQKNADRGPPSAEGSCLKVKTENQNVPLVKETPQVEDVEMEESCLSNGPSCNSDADCSPDAQEPDQTGSQNKNKVRNHKKLKTKNPKLMSLIKDIRASKTKSGKKKMSITDKLKYLAKQPKGPAKREINNLESERLIGQGRKALSLKRTIINQDPPSNLAAKNMIRKKKKKITIAKIVTKSNAIADLSPAMVTAI